MQRRRRRRGKRRRRRFVLVKGLTRAFRGGRIRRRQGACIAWDRLSKRRVVLKLYRYSKVAAHELRVLRAIGSSPHFVPLLHHGRYRRRRVIVMKYVVAPTLHQLVAKRGPLPRAHVIAILLGILSGLRHLHRRGWIHGDLHDGNVLVTDAEKGHVKLIDFQFAARKRRDGRARARRVLRRPSLKLPPESRKRIIDDRFDIYGVGYLGATMLLGGRPTRWPLPGDSTERQADPLWRVIDKAMRRYPGERFVSANHMRQSLGSLGGVR